MNASSLRGISRLTDIVSPYVLSNRGDASDTPRALALSEHAAFHDADPGQIAVPALDGVLGDVPVPAEQLHAVGSDLHRFFGGEDAGQIGLAVEGKPLLGATRRAQGQEAHSFQLEA